MREVTSPLHDLRGVTEQNPKSLIAAAYHNLRADIICGRLEPGSRLRVEHLKDDYNVGAGTLREALALLVADALVITQDQRGYRVAPMSLEDFRDITETRVHLETHATKLSIANGTDSWEGELASAFHQLNRAEERLGPERSGAVFDQWEICNRHFHQALLARCPSFWVLHLLQILYRQSERYRRLSLTHRDSGRDLHGEHKAIFDAAMARDGTQAAVAVAQHIHATYETIELLVKTGQVNLAVQSLLQTK
mgnify:FL=1